MSTWVQCNVCCAPPGGGDGGDDQRRFYVLSCGHILCQRCAAADGAKGKQTADDAPPAADCRLCSAAGVSATPINSAMPHRMQLMFLPPAKALASELRRVEREERWKEAHIEHNRQFVLGQLHEMEAGLRKDEAEYREKIKIARQLDAELTAVQRELDDWTERCRRNTETLEGLKRERQQLVDGAGSAGLPNVSLSSGGGASNQSASAPWPFVRRPRTPNTSKSPVAAEGTPALAVAVQGRPADGQFVTPDVADRLNVSFGRCTTSTPRLRHSGGDNNGGRQQQKQKQPHYRRRNPAESPFEPSASSLGARAPTTPVLAGNIALARRAATPLSAAAGDGGWQLMRAPQQRRA